MRFQEQFKHVVILICQRGILLAVHFRSRRILLVVKHIVTPIRGEGGQVRCLAQVAVVRGFRRFV